VAVTAGTGTGLRDGMRAQLERFLDFAPGPQAARVVNNADWLRPLDVMTLLRDIGKHFTVNYMLAKESVRRRLEQEDGISYTEFSYLLLQAYDFLVLFDRLGCTLQMGGSDQWGNITAGCDLIRRVRGAKAHGLVLPLVTSAGGVKFGKTEAGAIWLDPDRTTPYDFYQFWLNTDDRDVVAYLKYFTFLDEPAIRDLERTTTDAPERRDAQRTLAREVTKLVHGPEALESAERGAARMFGERLTIADEIRAVLHDVPQVEIAFGQEGVPITRLAVESGLESSSSAAIRLIRGGGLYLNDERVTNERERVTANQAIGGLFFVLRKGKRDRRVVQVKKQP